MLAHGRLTDPAREKSSPTNASMTPAVGRLSVSLPRGVGNKYCLSRITTPFQTLQLHAREKVFPERVPHLACCTGTTLITTVSLAKAYKAVAAAQQPTVYVLVAQAVVQPHRPTVLYDEYHLVTDRSFRKGYRC